MVNAIADIDVETPWLPKQGLISQGAAAATMAGEVALGIPLRFHHHHTPEQAAVLSAFDQQAPDRVGNDQLGRSS